MLVPGELITNWPLLRNLCQHGYQVIAESLHLLLSSFQYYQMLHFFLKLYYRAFEKGERLQVRVEWLGRFHHKLSWQGESNKNSLHASLRTKNLDRQHPEKSWNSVASHLSLWYVGGRDGESWTWANQRLAVLGSSGERELASVNKAKSCKGRCEPWLLHTCAHDCLPHTCTHCCLPHTRAHACLPHTCPHYCLHEHTAAIHTHAHTTAFHTHVQTNPLDICAHTTALNTHSHTTDFHTYAHTTAFHTHVHTLLPSTHTCILLYSFCRHYHWPL